MITLTAERLREVLDYDAETGVFTYKTSVGGVVIGSVAGGFETRGYRSIRVDGHRYREHRLAWLYVYGDFPKSELDHIDRDKGNNRISNLRLASRSQNMGNWPLKKSNTSGFRGVVKHNDRWRAKISIRGHRVHIGVYNSPQEAYEAYKQVAKAHFGEFFIP